MRQPDPPMEPEDCPFQVGDRVTVNDSSEYYSDWKDEVCRVTGIMWDYRSGVGCRLLVAIVSERDLSYRDPDCDGWTASELTKQ